MRAPSPAPGACGAPHGRTRLPRAPGKPASQCPIRSCEPAPRTPPQVVGRHHLGTQMPSGGVHPITTPSAILRFDMEELTMSTLLADVIEAHGGLDRWRSVSLAEAM